MNRNTNNRDIKYRKLYHGCYFMNKVIMCEYANTSESANSANTLFTQWL